MLRFAVVFLAFVIIGCAGSRNLTSRPIDLPSIARAESDELNDLKNAVHTSGNSQPDTDCKQSNRRSSCSPVDACSPNGVDSNSSGGLGTFVFMLPFFIPRAVLGDDYDHVTDFPDHPYADGARGSLLIDNKSDVYKQVAGGTLQTFAIPQAHDVDRFGGRLLLDTPGRFGIDTESNYWTQGLINKPSNELWTGDVNLVYRFAESERVQWRAGGGVNWLADNVKAEAGINLTYGFEWFPVRPWTVSSVFDVGSLGRAGLFHNRTTVGAMVGSTELFAGYDYFVVGSAAFHGPVAGVGWRF